MYAGFVETDLTASMDVEKIAPQEVVAAALRDLELLYPECTSNPKRPPRSRTAPSPPERRST